MNKTLEQFLAVKNNTTTSADLYFYGDIVSSWLGAWDNTDQYPEAVKTFLEQAKGKNLNIYINSGGGSVFAGMAIYNMIKRHDGYTTVNVDGLAGSIASIIALAGDKVIIPANAYFMIHRPLLQYVSGNSEELRKYADALDVLDEGMMQVYRDNLQNGVSEEKLRELVNAETYLNGIQAQEIFKIEVGKEINAVACIQHAQNIKNLPEKLKEIKQKEALAESERLELLKLKGEYFK